MIFSHPTVAAELSRRFECAWESVRPVPRVEIDFGTGRRLTRTLNGNVATYFCTSDGRVYDLLPGLVDPTEYLGRARSAAAAHQVLRRDHDRVGWVRRLQEERSTLARYRTAAPVKLSDATNGSALVKDAAFNRRHRYALARRLLRRAPFQRPADLQARVFKDVLKVDLDDPYLGLAPDLFGGELGKN